MMTKRRVYLKIKYLAIVLAALASPAAARQDPAPPPSGIVVHLFGPDSLSSHVLPSAPGAKPAAGAPAASNGAAYPEPSLGDVLHQMFVTGDPDQLPGQALAKGRAANRLSN
jgi:hypothetical protein